MDDPHTISASFNCKNFLVSMSMHIYIVKTFTCFYFQLAIASKYVARIKDFIITRLQSLFQWFSLF